MTISKRVFIMVSLICSPGVAASKLHTVGLLASSILPACIGSHIAQQRTHAGQQAPKLNPVPIHKQQKQRKASWNSGIEFGTYDSQR